jgi:chemotaxis protein methyltransferase CheR
MSQDMTKGQFDFFRKKIFELAGISLSDVKVELIQSRLRNRLTKKNLTSFDDYQKFLEHLPDDHEEWELFVNQLTTNKTDWFREPEHFDFLIETFLPEWKKLGKSHFKIWCAASSTGEEPYTLALVLNEYLANSKITFEIHASDIDTKVLKLALNGVYPVDRLEFIPEKFHHQFIRGTGEIESWMKVKPSLKSKVKFFQYNLANPPKSDEKYDLIFCRNVLIYFNPETILNVVDSLHERAHSDSLLVISHSESLQNVQTLWKFQRPSLYAKGKFTF